MLATASRVVCTALDACKSTRMAFLYASLARFGRERDAFSLSASVKSSSTSRAALACASSSDSVEDCKPGSGPISFNKPGLDATASTSWNLFSSQFGEPPPVTTHRPRKVESRRNAHCEVSVDIRLDRDFASVHIPT